MIYLTGDTHGGIDMHKISFSSWPESKKLTREDYLIVCGDFGFPFLDLETEPERPSASRWASRWKEYRFWIRWLAERPYTILWVDGNHDNHPYWAKQPVTEWNGGRVHIHPMADNVIHLMRGEYYTIDDSTFWVMGGAESIDFTYRAEGIDWWPSETPSTEERNRGIASLAAHDFKVDYVLTHQMPQDLILPVLRQNFLPFPSADYRALNPAPESTSQYLQKIYQMIWRNMTCWFCGHVHEDIFSAGYRIRVLYQDVVSLEEIRDMLS